MTCRLATHEDMSRIIILLQVLRGPELSTDEAIVREQFNALFDGKNRCAMLVLAADGNVAGMAVMNIVAKLPNLECHIDEVVVDESYREQGLGKTLMTHCEQWAWTNGADAIELTSRPSRVAANNLYQSLGYTIRDTNVYKKLKADDN